MTNEQIRELVGKYVNAEHHVPELYAFILNAIIDRLPDEPQPAPQTATPGERARMAAEEVFLDSTQGAMDGSFRGWNPEEWKHAIAAAVQREIDAERERCAEAVMGMKTDGYVCADKKKSYFVNRDDVLSLIRGS